MLSAFGPFVTDMYLPAMPQLQHYFGTDASSVQLSLSASMFGLAVGQIFFGPLSDKYGRRPVVIASLWLFIASTLACLWSASIEMFVIMRVLQGIGGSGGIVLSRSIATDRYWGEKLAKMMAVIGAIQGIAPVAAPIVGGMMTDSLGWKGIFTLLMIVGALLIVLLSCIGLCFSSTVAMAMNEEHGNAGAASALIGAMIFLLGAIVLPLVGIGNIIRVFLIRNSKHNILN